MDELIGVDSPSADSASRTRPSSTSPSPRRTLSPLVRDFVKTMEKHRSDVLQPGERFVGGLGTVPPGATRYSANPGGAIGAMAAFVKAAQEGGSTWVTVTETGLYLGLTDRRLLVFGQSGIKGDPTDLRGEAPLTDVTLRTEDSKAGPLGKARLYLFTLTDGRHLAVECNISWIARKLADRFDAAWASATANRA